MQWRIINDRRPIIAMSCDKLASKQYAHDIAQSQGLDLRFPRIYWVGTDVRELRGLSGRLPSRWVLKPNHSSGRYALIDADATPVDWDELVRLGNRWVQRDEEELGLGHWGYGQARHLLIAEERIGSGDSVVSMKVHTTNGDPRWYGAGIGNKSNRRRWRHNAAFERIRPDFAPDNAADLPSPIDLLDDKGRSELTTIASALTRDFDHQRCDLYYENGSFWFCEFSTYAQGGIGTAFLERDEAVASTWRLPSIDVIDSEQERYAAYLSTQPKGTLS